MTIYMDPVRESDHDESDWDQFPIGRVHIVRRLIGPSEEIYYLRCRVLTGNLRQLSSDLQFLDRAKFLFQTYHMEAMAAWGVHHHEFTDVVRYWLERHAHERGVPLVGQEAQDFLPPNSPQLTPSGA